MENLGDKKTEDDPKNTYKFFKHDRKNRIRYFKNAEGEVLSTQSSKEEEDRRRLEKNDFNRMFKLCEEKLIKSYQDTPLFSPFLNKKYLHSLHWRLYTSFPTLEAKDKKYNLVRKERDRTRDILLDLLRMAIEQKDFGLFQTTFRFFEYEYSAPIVSIVGSRNIGSIFYPTIEDVPSLYVCNSLGQDMQKGRVDKQEATGFVKEFFPFILNRFDSDAEKNFKADWSLLTGTHFEWQGFEDSNTLDDRYLLKNRYLLRYDTLSYHVYCRYVDHKDERLILYLVHFCRRGEQEVGHDPTA